MCVFTYEDPAPFGDVEVPESNLWAFNYCPFYLFNTPRKSLKKKKKNPS